MNIDLNLAFLLAIGIFALCVAGFVSISEKYGMDSK